VNRKLLQYFERETAAQVAASAIPKTQCCRGFYGCGRQIRCYVYLPFGRRRFSKIGLSAELIVEWVQANYVRLSANPMTLVCCVLSQKGKLRFSAACSNFAESRFVAKLRKQVSDNHRIWERWRWGMTTTKHRPIRTARLAGGGSFWPRAASSG
jgi:hypothetical protein